MSAEDSQTEVSLSNDENDSVLDGRQSAVLEDGDSIDRIHVMEQYDAYEPCGALTGQYDLEDVSPAEAIQDFIDSKQYRVGESSIETYESKLNQFLEFCEEQNLHSMSNLNGRLLSDWEQHRASNVAATTLEKDLEVLKQCLTHAATVGFIEPQIVSAIDPTKLDIGVEDEVRLDPIDWGRAKSIVESAGQIRYGSREHTIVSLFLYTGMRLGTLRSLDRDDFYIDGETAYLKPKHKPAKGTALKNGEGGERPIWLPLKAANVLSHYLDCNHPEVRDEFGRMPLIGTTSGRPQPSTFRRDVYAMSLPCVVNNSACPIEPDERPEDAKNVAQCPAESRKNNASKCPESVSPHQLRSTHITKLRDEGLPFWLIMQRCNVSMSVLRKHYLERPEKEKFEDRTVFLDIADFG
ncbi:site-specific integrase [Natronomonas salina]|uniref:tyrosine-type recombinase/integrase n=1 Tax=Natronomonas salina TaxID=1710540 RepID=UPI0015B57E67|nr:site-specific integrase [Natronomonas salina]QLD89172.1 site-specific integrase [Natronomonas salina]